MSRRDPYLHPAAEALIEEHLAAIRAIWDAPGVAPAKLTLTIRHRKLPGGAWTISDNDVAGALEALKNFAKVGRPAEPRADE